MTTQSNILYLIYDGECPICSHAAKVIKIRQAVGKMEIINARENHPLVIEAKKQGYDLDKGIVIKYQGKSYYGKEAMHLLAMLGSPVGVLNKINVFLFKSKFLLAIFYPIFKFIRRCLLLVIGVKPIKPDNSEPIFKSIFDSCWDALPSVLKKHYANKAFSDDVVKLEGVMDIELSKLTRLMKPLFRLTGALVPYEGKDIPTIVYSKSEPDSNNYVLERHFNIPYHKPYTFRSKFVPIKRNDVVEIIKFRIGWRCHYSWNGEKVMLTHKGYYLYIFGALIPIPLGLLLGKVYAEEIALDEDNFKMMMVITHPLFGKTFEYKGQFRVI